MRRGENWEVQRRRALQRDSRECRYCGADGELHVHHIEPFEAFDSDAEADRLTNLITLCASCHRRWERLGLRMDPPPSDDVGALSTETVNIALDGHIAEWARDVKDDLGLTWAQFIERAADELGAVSRDTGGVEPPEKDVTADASVTHLNITLNDRVADQARATKDELELTWAEFVVRGAGELPHDPDLVR